MMRLEKNQLVKIRLAGSGDGWARGVVIQASGGDPQSVALLIDGLVRSHSGGWIGGGMPLTINYELETATSLIGDQYEMEVVEA